MSRFWENMYNNIAEPSDKIGTGIWDNAVVDKHKIHALGLTYKGRDAYDNRIWEDASGRRYYAIELATPESDDGSRKSEHMAVNNPARVVGGLTQDLHNLFFPKLPNPAEMIFGKCICQTGLNVENFKSFFGLKKDYIFNHSNMVNYKTYKTPIKDFLVEVHKLFEDPYNVNNCYRKAHLLAQMWWETARWTTLEEFASGNAYNPSQRTDAAKNGNTEEGDGPKYKGRGCLQLTWKNNYRAYGDFVHKDLVKNYKDVADDLFLAVNSGGWFWKIGKALKGGKTGNYNEQADAKHTDTISRWVNGGGNGLSERRTKTNELLKLFNANHCINMKSKG